MTKKNEQNNIEALFRDREYCYRELWAVIEIYSNGDRFNDRTAASLLKGIALMRLYCPNDMNELVESQLNELIIRRRYIKRPRRER